MVSVAKKIELKNCPFCGGEAERTDYYYAFYEDVSAIRCKKCGISTKVSVCTVQIDNSPSNAIERWNTRHEEQA